MKMKGKRAFIAGVGDDRGFAWAIAKSLADQGVEVILGVWPPVMRIFEKSLASGKFSDSSALSDGSQLSFMKIYPFDASFDTMDDVPEEILNNKRYKDHQEYSIAGIAQKLEEEYGKIDLLVHSLANAPEVKNSLLDTSRRGYLEAISTSAYSLVSMLNHFGPRMNSGGAVVSLSFLAAQRTVPGYGGGMSTAKACLESDTRTLAWEAGRKWGIRVNTISAGAIKSRAGSAIGFIEKMQRYQEQNAPLTTPFTADAVGNAASFLLSPLSQAITGTTLYVDNGMHTMGVAVDSPALSNE